jgi:nitrogen-specific signal transduction histidine kinase
MPLLRRHALRDLVPFGSPLLALIEQVRGRNAAVNEYRVDLSTPRNPGERVVDLHVAVCALRSVSESMTLNTPIQPSTIQQRVRIEQVLHFFHDVKGGRIGAACWRKQ